MLALPLTIPLIILTVNVSAFVSFSTWVCLTYGAFFGMLFSIYEFRHRKHGKFTMAGKAGADKTWNDYLNGTQHLPAAKRVGFGTHDPCLTWTYAEQYGFMQSFKARTAFLICLGFFMAGAGPLGWATSTFCFLHGLFNLYVYCGNEQIRQEVQSGTFNGSGATQGDGFDKAARNANSTVSVAHTRFPADR